MTFTEPIDFAAARRVIADKKIQVTDLSSAQIARLRDEFDIRGLFSARTLNAQLLQGYQDELKDLISQQNLATARVKIKDLIDELQIAPPSEEEAGTITDLGSNARIGLVLRTNLDMARGKGQYDEGMSEGALDAYPALELVRAEARAVPRDWPEIWDAAAAELGASTSATDAAETGRMVALKGDPIWLAISDFDQPWPPFKFNSGMGVEDVSYEDAVDLGVMDADAETPRPEQLDFNHGVEASVAQLAPELVQVLGESLSGIAEKIGDAFRLKSTPPAPVRAVNNRLAWTLELLEAA